MNRIIRALWFTVFLLLMGMVWSCNGGKSNISPTFSENPLQPEQDSLSGSLLADTLPGVSVEDSESMSGVDTLATAELLAEDGNAYGQLNFGMSPQEVNQLNATHQKLVRYAYHFSYAFNDQKELYAIFLRSDAEQAIYYETRLQGKYSNLCRIIAEKHGNKGKCGTLPSIFDVMNSKTLYLATWRLDHKLIQLGITQVDLNGYKVLCKISNPAMEKEAKHQEYLKKNKKLINAADKF